MSHVETIRTAVREGPDAFDAPVRRSLALMVWWRAWAITLFLAVVYVGGLTYVGGSSSVFVRAYLLGFVTAIVGIRLMEYGR